MYHIRGFAKFKKFKINLDRAHAGAGIQTSFLWKPITDMDTHSNHNSQQPLNSNADRIQMVRILLQNISTGLGLFWDNFPKKAE